MSPESCGARCDVCPLRSARVAGPMPVREPSSAATAAVVLTEPHPDDLKQGHYLASKGSAVLTDAFKKAGLPRNRVHVTSLLLCIPPGKDTDRWLKALPADQPNPIACCAPRLQRELEAVQAADGTTNVLALGAKPLQALAAVSKGIGAYRGRPLQVEWSGLRLNLLPTWAPAMVHRDRKQIPVLEADVARADRFFRDELRWVDPDWFAPRSAAEVEAFFVRACKTGTISYDYETTLGDPLYVQVKCVGFGIPHPLGGGVNGVTRDKVMVVPFLVRNPTGGSKRFWSVFEEERVKAIIARYMRHDRLTWFGHNAFSFDRMVSEKFFGTYPDPLYDTLLLHKCVAPDQRHALAYVASVYTDATSWKEDAEGNMIRDKLDGPDDELHAYNAQDCQVTNVVARALWEEVADRGYFEPLPFYDGMSCVDVQHWMGDFCVDLHKIGVYVDQAKRRALTIENEKKSASFKAPLLDFAAQDHAVLGAGTAKAGASFNPNSGPQVRTLIYDVWGLEADPELFTETGLPGVSDEVLRSFILDAAPIVWDDPKAPWGRKRAASVGNGLMLGPDADTHARRFQFLWLLRRFRKVENKVLGTFLRPYDPDLPLKNGYEDESGEKVSRLIWHDGRARGDWKPFPRINRLACSKPALQIILPEIKPMFTAGRGRILAGADLDQIHLRIIAVLWKIPTYQRIFDLNGDPHAGSALLLFGKLFKEAPGFPGGVWKGDVFVPDGTGKWKGLASELRKLAKVFVYAFVYGAEPATIWAVLSKAEDEAGNLVMLQIILNMGKILGMHGTYSPVDVITKFRDTLLRNEPGFNRAWTAAIDRARRGQDTHPRRVPWYKDDLLGWHVEFPNGTDGAEKSNVINSTVLPVEAAIMHKCMMKLQANLKARGWYSPEEGIGIIFQVHDSATIEIPLPPGTGDMDRDCDAWHRTGAEGAAMVADAMNIAVPGWPVRVTASGLYGHTAADA